MTRERLKQMKGANEVFEILKCLNIIILKEMGKKKECSKL